MNQYDTYSAVEKAALAAHWPVSTRAQVLEALPGRSWDSMRKQAQNQKLRRPDPQAWTPEHEAILREHYPSGGAVEVAKLTGRTLAQCYDKAYRISIRYEGKPGPVANRHRPALRKKKPREISIRQRLAAERREERLRKLLTPKPKPVPAPKVAKAPKAPAPVTPKPDPVRPPSARTPNLNAQKNATVAKQKQAAEKPKDYVSADMIRVLPPTHPARVAYTRAAYKGMPAAQAAFHEAMKQAA
jgi:hypothetical protein